MIIKTRKETEISDEPMRSKRLLLAGVACAAGLGGAGLAWWHTLPSAVVDPHVDAFWLLSFEQPDGSTLAMQGFKGQPLLLNFWATWCPPCVEELPLLESIWRQNHDKKLQILGLAVDQPSSVRRFLTQSQLSFPIGLAGLTGTELGRSLGNTMAALPFSVLFDVRGQVIAQKMGKLEPTDLTRWLALLT
jgi:thiol-disulfide isomerase/thioredoxin